MGHREVGGGNDSLIKLGLKLGIIVLLFAGAMLAITMALSTRDRASAWDEGMSRPAPAAAPDHRAAR